MTSRNTVATTLPTDDPFFNEVLSDPIARAAFEDAQARSELIDSLVRLRNVLKVTQAEIARRTGVTQPTVSGFETEGSDPRLSTLQRYARAVEATLVVRISMPAHCDWIPRSDSYAPPSAARTPDSAVSRAAAAWPAPPTQLATSWAQHRRSEFARAA